MICICGHSTQEHGNIDGCKRCQCDETGTSFVYILEDLLERAMLILSKETLMITRLSYEKYEKLLEEYETRIDLDERKYLK